MIIGVAELTQYRVNHNSMTTPIRDDKLWGYNLPWSVFVLGVCLLSSQRWSRRVEDRATRDFCLGINSVYEDAGDASDMFGRNYEIKSSILTETSDGKMNLVQIRPWQEVDYVILVFDLRNGYEPYLFCLSSAELAQELVFVGGSSAHGTQAANRRNQNIEQRMSLNVDPSDPHFSRWCKSYRREGTIIDR